MWLISALDIGLGHVRQLFSRIGAVFRHEGCIGLYDRIRYPKPFWRRDHLPAPIEGPVLIQGGNLEDREQIALALRNAGLPQVASLSEDPATSIKVDPPISNAELFSSKDILVLLSPQNHFLPNLLPLARRCRAVLSDCPDILYYLQQHGIPLGKVFSLKGRHALHEGITRYLLASRTACAEHQDWNIFSDLCSLPPRPRICLSLPETLERRQNFLSADPGGFRIFDGIRYTPGWIGAATSFSMMAQACLDQQVGPALFCEDDVELAPDFEKRLHVIHTYLEDHNWDVFSGLLTDVGPDYRVTKVTHFGGEVFIHLNRCVGMVCSLYNCRALTRLASWTEESGLPIDRYLESSVGLEVVTTLPFLAGHSDTLTSSVWGFGNRRYRNMIKNSEARLNRLLMEHEPK